MFTKLALRNVRRQIGNYLIYFITVSLTVALLFAVNNIIFGDEIAKFAQGMTEMRTGLAGFVVFIALIVAFVLSYATSFMLRLRKREFGTYLTLGMTRKNILTIFVFETAIICLIAMGIGLVLGLFIYQGLMAIFMHLLNMEFAISAYSMNGMLFTIALVTGIFIISSVASALYLKKVSIYDLIHGDKKVEKSVKHPLVWLIITVLTLVVCICSIAVFYWSVDEIMMKGMNANYLFLSLFAFAGSMILFHVALSKSLVYVLMKRKRFCSRGTHIFVLRQLSAVLGSNALMIGLLAFLLSFSVIAANVCFVQKAMQELSLNQNCPYDIVYSDNLYSTGDTGKVPLPQAEEVIESYKHIEAKYPYALYTTGKNDFYRNTRWSGEGYAGLTDSFMSVSDFNAVTQPLGFDPVVLNDTYLIVANLPEITDYDWENFTFTWKEQDYKYGGVTREYPSLAYMYFYVVVPDAAVEDMKKEVSYMAYDITDGEYDAASLRQALSYTVEREDGAETYERTDFRFREYSRQQENATSAILVVGALFAAAIFLFMAMAILALKTLSGLSDDKKRYQILYRLGTGEKEQGRTLFAQTFTFFLTPFAACILISVPTAMIIKHIITLSGMAVLQWQIYGIAASIAGVMTLIYILYYAATYMIAKKAVVHR